MLNVLFFTKKFVANLLINSQKDGILSAFYARKHKKGRTLRKNGTSMLHFHPSTYE